MSKYLRQEPPASKLALHLNRDADQPPEDRRLVVSRATTDLQDVEHPWYRFEQGDYSGWRIPDGRRRWRLVGHRPVAFCRSGATLSSTETRTEYMPAEALIAAW